MSTVHASVTEQELIQRLLSTYSPPRGRYDELLDEHGEMRAPYREVLRHMVAEDDPSLAGRRRQAEGIIRKDGITYNVYGDPKGMDRPWALDLLPIILGQREWSHIEAGIRQRVTVLNHLLADIHGPQRLIHQRVVPPEFVMANPRFLRPCHGIAPPRAGHIVRYAADLVRDASGTWRVYSDRTQTPSGAGYALENRIVMARTFPNLIQDACVQRLASFFSCYCSALRAASPTRSDDPTIAMLTPGALNETYFEHVYLARYLGYPLVEGEDLAVRDNQLYMRTVEGLEQIDVALRLVDDAFCDPLELRRDSILGPIGLLQALRSGNVSVCNAVGSGALEVSALKAILPRLCRHLLGEELRLPCTQTYWGALPEHREVIAARLDEAPLFPAFLSRAINDPNEHPEARRQRWSERPHDFVMHDDPAASVAPVLVDQGLAARSVMLRVYAVIHGDTGEIHVMPGGLARFSESGDLPNFTMQRGSGSKDVWVLSDAPVEYRGLLRNQDVPLSLMRSPSNLPSRMAENLLWLGRYCERTENCVRFMRHVLLRTAEEDWPFEHAEILRLIEAEPSLYERLQANSEVPQGTGDEAAAPRALMRAEVEAVQRAIIACMCETEDPAGIAAMVHAIRRALWIVRERFSEDDWRIVHEFTQAYHDRIADVWSLQSALDAFNDLVTGFAAFSGLSRENMTREPGQFFLDIGRRIERTLNTVETIEKCLVVRTENEATLLGSLLAVFDSPMTYRARYGGGVQLAPVLDLLLADETNPRAVAYQLARLARHLPWLPKSGHDGLLNAEERVLERIRTEIRTTDMNTLGRVGPDGRRPALEALTGMLARELPVLADLLSQRYFIHTEPAQQLGTWTEAMP